MIGAAYCIAALALSIELILAGIQRAVTPRGLVLAGKASLQVQTSVA